MFKLCYTEPKMHLSHIHLEHFRNYTRLDFDFPEEPIVVLSGENAQGKTSFLEAIYLLALTKSFRTSNRDFLRQFERDYYRIEVGIHDIPYPITLELCELYAPAHQRVLKKNGTKISSSKFIGHLRVVLFRPEDLQMLIGEPSLRRRYLNSILIQTVPGYMKQLQLYQKLLQQRNALLLQAKLKSLPISAVNSQLDLWDEQLAEAGSALTTSRIGYVEFVQNQLQKEKSAYGIAYTSPALELEREFDKNNASHSSFCPGTNNATNTEPVNDTQLRSRELQGFFLEKLHAALISSRFHDLRSTHTSVGPHRDDLKLSLRDRPIELTASRGELRIALMQLKQAEIAWIQHKTGDTPIILLDDIFSELDTQRKNDFLQLIPAHSQAILTIADGNPLPTNPRLRATSTVRRIHAGKLLLTQVPRL